jgi:predicted RNA-binding Zn-ribbon protein involved in translation (DUF1610 family)
MPKSRKVNLEKVQAFLGVICPKCGDIISPAQIRRVDFEHIVCPVCGERFALSGKQSMRRVPLESL